MALFNHLMRNHCQRDQDQRRNNDQIVQVTDNRDKIGDEVKGQQGIPHGQAEKNSGCPGCSPIGQHTLINLRVR